MIYISPVKHLLPKLWRHDAAECENY